MLTYLADDPLVQNARLPDQMLLALAAEELGSHLQHSLANSFGHSTM